MLVLRPRSTSKTSAKPDHLSQARPQTLAEATRVTACSGDVNRVQIRRALGAGFAFDRMGVEDVEIRR